MSIAKQIELLNNIPDELKRLNQWLVWKAENVDGSDKPTKIPYNAKTGTKASVTDPSSWCSFDHAINSLANGGSYSGIGFVFTPNDCYCLTDLDHSKDFAEKQIEIFKKLNSYSEISPSGKGLHIITKATIPSGCRKNSIEIYSSHRYATFTGNVYHNKPIEDRQNEITQLYNELKGDKNDNLVIEEPERYSDTEIIEQCRSAINGEKFNILFSGEWRSNYPSQSEADLALINIIVFYTKNRDQIYRIFRSSALGKRAKSSRSDYLNRLIQKAFDQTVPSINFELNNKEIEEKLLQHRKECDQNNSGTSVSNAIHSGPRNNASPLSSNSKVGADRPVAQRLEPAAHNGLVAGSSPAGPTKCPLPGLLSELAQFIYDAAPRPVYEIAFAGAIGLMAGICGRAYNVSGTGLNQYILMLAKTGMGKEAMASGIDKLMSEIKFEVPPSINFIGPSHIASGQALVKYIHTKSQCFVSILDEFGMRLQRMSAENAPSHEKMLKQILLEVYQKSGKSDVFHASIFADQDKDTKATTSPAFSILGYGVPQTFYQSLTEEMIFEGLIPRFMIFEYNGERKYFNENCLTISPKDKKYGLMLDKFSTLVAYCSQLMYEQKVVNVELTDEAKQTSVGFDRYTTELINKTDDEITLKLWNRAHLKSIKLAALFAISVNYITPIITKEQLDYCIKLVCNDIRALSNKFRKGEIGKPTNETSQLTVLKKLIREFYSVKLVAKTYDKFKPYQDNFILPHSYLAVRLGNYPEFYKHVLGRTRSIKQAVGVLLDEGLLVKVPTKHFEKLKLNYLEGYVLSDFNLDKLVG